MEKLESGSFKTINVRNTRFSGKVGGGKEKMNAAGDALSRVWLKVTETVLIKGLFPTHRDVGVFSFC